MPVFEAFVSTVLDVLGMILEVVCHGVVLVRQMLRHVQRATMAFNLTKCILEGVAPIFAGNWADSRIHVRYGLRRRVEAGNHACGRVHQRLKGRGQAGLAVFSI